jgi:hypothetical protein
MFDTLSLSFDAGLLVLIWMVQLIVYPSFLYYERNNLIIWHQKYTGLITMIVAPLMFGQLGSSIYALIDDLHSIAIVKLVLIFLVWLSTFLYFAPTHGKISKDDFSERTLQELVKRNWFRTITWTLVFVLAFFNF